MPQKNINMENSTIYIDCPPLQPDRVSLAFPAIEAWLRSSALTKLIGSFGSKIPNGLKLESLIYWLLDFSNQWDFRRLQREAAAKDIGEGARWLLNSTEITTYQQQIIKESVSKLGLTGISEPSRRTFDLLIVLGGARLSCLLRPRWAARLVIEKRIIPKTVILLASSRPVADSERDATDTYAKNANSEFDLMNAGAESSFQITKKFTEERYDDPTNVNKSWVIRQYTTTAGFPKVISLSAPSSEPDSRRANSADTYEFVFSKFRVPPGSSLLLVTSQIYVPYQQLEAIRTVALPHEVVVETIGFPSEWAGELQGMTGATNYLQEIRSTIQSAYRFIKAYSKSEN